MSTDDRLLQTVPDAALRLGVKSRTLYEWCAKGLVPHVKIGHRVLIPVAVVLTLEEQIRTVMAGWRFELRVIAPKAETPQASAPIPFQPPRRRHRTVL